MFQFGSANPDLNYVSASRDPGGYNGHAVNYYPYHTPLSKSYEWSLSVQRQLAAGLVAEVAYVGNHGTGLSFPVDSNQVPQNLLGPGDAQGRRPYSQYLGINGNTYNAISNYDSLQLSIKKRFGNGFSFDANYTWSKYSRRTRLFWLGPHRGQSFLSKFLFSRCKLWFMFGNSGRNILRGPGLADVDFSFGKYFAIPVFGESSRLQLRFDATNILNHANFSNPNAQIGTPAAGIITSTVTNTERSLQLGARFWF